jgi:hypothetical protein
VCDTVRRREEDGDTRSSWTKGEKRREQVEISSELNLEQGEEEEMWRMEMERKKRPKGD